ncbi:MAG: FecR domain-containing protein [Gemmatimonadota bacterium]
MARAVIVVVLLLALGVPGSCPAATDGEAIGVVRISAGPATVTRGERVLPAAVGTKLRAGDIIATGPGGSLGIVLQDDSSLSLGPGSRLVVREFLFSPAEGKLSLLVRLSRGTLACISGLIGKLAPGSVRFETPAATIGIRGTRFAVRAGGPDGR